MDFSFYKKVLDEYHPGYRYTWEIYFGKVREMARKSDAWLDAGCGRNGVIADVRTGYSVGIDLEIDPELKNRERFVRGDLAEMPFRDGAFDLITADFVVEHLGRPAVVFRELSRVLNAGGHLVVRTTNRLNYFFFVASLLPTRWKEVIVRVMYGKQDPIHRARYRLNTPFALSRISRTSGLVLEEITMNESLHFLHPFLFGISLLVERVLSIGSLRNLKNNMIAVWQTWTRSVVRHSPQSRFAVKWRAATRSTSS